MSLKLLILIGYCETLSASMPSISHVCNVRRNAVLCIDTIVINKRSSSTSLCTTRSA